MQISLMDPARVITCRKIVCTFGIFVVLRFFMFILIFFIHRFLYYFLKCLWHNCCILLILSIYKIMKIKYKIYIKNVINFSDISVAFSS